MLLGDEIRQYVDLCPTEKQTREQEVVYVLIEGSFYKPILYFLILTRSCLSGRASTPSRGVLVFISDQLFQTPSLPRADPQVNQNIHRKHWLLQASVS